MIVKLDEKACSLDADELVAFVRLSFNADKDGYVYGSNKELSEKIGMSVAKTKKLLMGYFRSKWYLSETEKSLFGSMKTT